MGILAVLLAIIALLCGLLATLMFGTTGFIITLVLALAAIALGILKRVKAKKGGIPAIVIAVIAILIGFGVSNLWSSIFHTLHDRAVEYMPDRQPVGSGIRRLQPWTDGNSKQSADG